jgi:hypothetical protein
MNYSSNKISTQFISIIALSQGLPGFFHHYQSSGGNEVITLEKIYNKESYRLIATLTIYALPCGKPLSGAQKHRRKTPGRNGDDVHP